MSKRPNILFLMTDEERYPPCYETDEIRRFRREQLPGQQAIRARAAELHRHYAASVACAPSRASLFTGHYPTLHGVRATDGAAKAARDADVFWLDPHTVPTMGDYFRAAGYRTHYRGKWHVSHADLITPDSHASLASNDAEGNVHGPNTALYRATQRLDPYGFSGWVGPDPHGIAQSNCGKVRDPLFGDQVEALFAELEAEPDDRPWLAVASFVNPHDIALYGILWASWRYEVDDDTVPDIDAPPTQRESLRRKPSCQSDFVDKYNKVFVPQPQIPRYRRFYYYLHKLVDRQIERVIDRLDASRFADDTVVVYTSDHGDMLGAHGGMHQKWHNAYEESWHVPLLVAGPGIAPGFAVEQPTSHVDLMPTLLGLAGADVDALREQLAGSHSEAQRLVGRDLSGLLRGEEEDERPIYFMTEDEISEGLDQTTLIGRSYDAVEEPAKVEGVVARLNGTLYKYARYYETSAIGPQDEGRRRLLDREKQEYELYDLDADPTETENLAHRRNRTDESRAVQDELAKLLDRLREDKARHPQNRFNP